MRVSEYAPNTKQELDEIWAGLRGIAKWLSTVVPSDSTSMMGGRAEMQDYVNKNVRDMMRLVGRYTDKNDRPISNKTLHELALLDQRQRVSRVGVPAEKRDLVYDAGVIPDIGHSFIDAGLVRPLGQADP